MSGTFHSFRCEAAHAISYNPGQFKPGWKGGGRPANDLACLIARRIFSENEEHLYKKILAALNKGLDRGDMNGLKLLADRAFGRLPQPLEHAGHDGGAIEIVFHAKKPEWLP